MNQRSERLDQGLQIDFKFVFPRRMRIAGLSLLAAGALFEGVMSNDAVSGFGANVQEFAHVKTTPPTKQERQIAQVIAIAMPVEQSIRVSCMDDSSKGRNGHTLSVPLIGMLPIVELDSSVCNDVVNYVDSTDKSQLTIGQISSISTLTHEVDHVRFDSRDEAATECRAIQDLPKVFQALGASRDDRKLIQQISLDDYFADNPEGYRTSDCHDGGPYDLDMAHVGRFPYPPARSSNSAGRR